MAVKIPGRRADKRVEQILRDPKTYFEQARKNARAEIKAEQARRRGRLSRRTA